MEEKKKGKGVKVFLVIFIILFLLAASALGYGYMKYKDLKTENTNLNTKYENISKDLDKTKSDLEKANKSVEKTNKKSSSADSEHFVKLDGLNLYATGFNTAVVSYKGEMYLVTGYNSDYPGTDALVLSKTMIKKGLKGGKYGFATRVTAVNNDGETDYTIDWRACSKKDDYCHGDVAKIGIKESEVNRAVVDGAPGATDARQLPVIVTKDGSVYEFWYDKGFTKELEKVNLEHKDVDNVKVTCDGKGETCKNYIYELTLKNGTTVTETKSIRNGN